jgi:RimJ/RimL family protein N-acetyltransferase
MSVILVAAHSDDLSASINWLELGLQDSPAEEFRSAAGDILRQVTKPIRAERWGAFWATQSVGGRVRAVGLCSYKTEPTDLQIVEIAYYTFPHREGCGIATAMARELTERASPHVIAIIAHTLPIESASCKVLRRCGYVRVGEAIDPEDGLVWRWQLLTNSRKGQ